MSDTRICGRCQHPRWKHGGTGVGPCHHQRWNRDRRAGTGRCGCLNFVEDVAGEPSTAYVPQHTSPGVSAVPGASNASPSPAAEVKDER